MSLFDLTAKSQECSEGDSESEEDADYTPIEPVDDWKKVGSHQETCLVIPWFVSGICTSQIVTFVSLFQTIQVGSDYQATVPDGLCKYGDAPGMGRSKTEIYAHYLPENFL